MLAVIFWFCAFIVFYTYLGYAVLIYLLAKYRPYKSMALQNSYLADLPPVTLFIAAYNEEDVIPEKMENCLSLDYPLEKLTILWVIDGSNDGSEQLLRQYPQVAVVNSPERKGKTAAINHGMEHVNTPIVVFSDANCMLNQDALTYIVAQFEDTGIGCVSGEKRVDFASDDAVSSRGESTYWKYESFLKRQDFRYYSAVGAAGELFAIRTPLFEPMPEDTLLDDFMLSMRIAQKGHRIAYTADAYAVERGSLNMEEEAKRKKRIAAGGWQSMMRLSGLLNVFVYGRLSFQYLSHRVLRWSITPFALFALFPLTIALVLGQASSWNVFLLILAFQLLFYLCAGIGYLKKDQSTVAKIFYIPYYFLFMNVNVLLGIFYLLNRRRSGIWEKSRRR